LNFFRASVYTQQKKTLDERGQLQIYQEAIIDDSSMTRFFELQGITLYRRIVGRSSNIVSHVPAAHLIP